jgi:FKBP-type peptidyl-prolyl cis-trans isomerase
MIALALLLAAAAPARHRPVHHRPINHRPVHPTAVPARPAIVTTASGLRIQTLKPGSGPRPVRENLVLVTYEGRLADGTVFDKAEQPVGFGVSDVVPGFAEALLLMQKGGTYRIWIPAALGYGAEGAGGGTIPPNADLDFTVTLIDLGSPPTVSVPPPPGG